MPNHLAAAVLAAGLLLSFAAQAATTQTFTGGSWKERATNDKPTVY